MHYLSRKIDIFLKEWKARDHFPLIVKGARQVGKTESVLHFVHSAYKAVVYINFAEKPLFKSITASGYDAQNIVREISNLDPTAKFIAGETAVVFDEIQEHPDIATAFKFFKIDGRYDVIATGSLLGVQYKRISSLSVGYQEDFEMHSLDFEEYLWARGRNDDFVDMIFSHMASATPFSESELIACNSLFREYCILGGMPNVVSLFVSQGNFQGTLARQRLITRYYKADARKYAEGLDQARIIEAYEAVPGMLAKENKKYQYARIKYGARARDYTGCIKWLEDAGMVVRANKMIFPELPVIGNLNVDSFKIYIPDSGLLLSMLDDEATEDFKTSRNMNTYNGGIAENIVAEALAKAGRPLCYFRKDDSTLEMDFFLRTTNRLVPVEVKATNNRSKSLATLISSEHYPDISFGVKLTGGNIGHTGAVWTFPHFCTFLLPRFVATL